MMPTSCALQRRAELLRRAALGAERGGAVDLRRSRAGGLSLLLRLQQLGDVGRVEVLGDLGLALGLGLGLLLRLGGGGDLGLGLGFRLRLGQRLGLFLRGLAAAAALACASAFALAAASCLRLCFRFGLRLGGGLRLLLGLPAPRECELGFLGQLRQFLALQLGLRLGLGLRRLRRLDRLGRRRLRLGLRQFGGARRRQRRCGVVVGGLQLGRAARRRRRILPGLARLLALDDLGLALGALDRLRLRPSRPGARRASPGSARSDRPPRRRSPPRSPASGAGDENASSPTTRNVAWPSADITMPGSEVESFTP